MLPQDRCSFGTEARWCGGQDNTKVPPAPAGLGAFVNDLGPGHEVSFRTSPPFSFQLEGQYFMGLFDWIKGKIAGPSPSAPSPRGEELVPRFGGTLGICPYCSADLKSNMAQVCLRCGVDWHDLNNVVRRGAMAETPLLTIAAEVTTERRRKNDSDRSSSTTTPNVPARPAPPVPRKLDNLDLGPLAPLASNQVRSEAKQLSNRFGNPWFGRRDLIPPLSDKRTELIDRGMLGQGLITPEELEEIHRVGLVMDELRPQLDAASSIAQAAVERSIAERAEIKARKKAEADERRRVRQEQIQHRRATDIFFLGRGVSNGLAERQSDAAALQKFGLPVLSTPADLAVAIGISVPRLRWLAFHNEAATRVHYVTFTVLKKSGGVRQLAAPQRTLRLAQEWILREILNKLPVHEAAHGFAAGRSTVSNAAPHVRQEVVLNADLCDFFPSISFARVKGAFAACGYSPAVATILALLCTESPRRKVTFAGKVYHVAVGPRGLPQGACTSPALSNRISRKLDQRLAGIARKLGWNYTRYADDLSFSASGEAGQKAGYLLARLRHITQEEGFAVNEKKTRVQRRNTRQSVTGIVVNERLASPRTMVKRVRAILHQAAKTGLAAQNKTGRPHFPAYIQGQIAYIAMVNPKQGARLKEAWLNLPGDK
jgi:RNA-directed DNA polymerase